MSPRIAAPRAISSKSDSFAECSALPQADLGPSISTPEALGFPHFMTTEITTERTQRWKNYSVLSIWCGIGGRFLSTAAVGFPDLPPLMDRFPAAAR
jgi:hypothetical protein